MNKIPSSVAIVAWLLALAGGPGAAEAQSFETLGPRAAGMGGAFVAVADDATAVYWNPAGLATSGRLFNISVDFMRGEPDLDTIPAGVDRERSAGFVGLATPPLGLSYYRLDVTRVTPAGASLPLQRFVTHNAGITLVQSIGGLVAVGTTLRYVRSESQNDFDADIGAMAVLGQQFRAGVTVRNLRQPDLETITHETFEMKRQSRAGVAFVGVPGLIVSADMDLERTAGSVGEERNFAVGTEAQLYSRVAVRAGFRINTEDVSRFGVASGHPRVVSLGTSVTTFRSLIVDAQVTLGSKAGDRGWGIAARMVY
jgi:hypothetical protein